MTPAPGKSRTSFPRLSAAAFQHYDDVKTTRALQGLPAFKVAMTFISEKLLEKATRLHHLSHCIRLGPKQGGDLYREFVRASEILSMPVLPELYVSPESGVNAFAIGMKQATIVLTRGLVEMMNPAETLAVIGHELGHVKCQHMVNKTVASLIAQYGMGTLADQIPFFGPAALFALQAHLMAWSRKAELSCDRAAMLVVQDASVVASLLAKLGGWPSSLGEVNLEALLAQVKDYDSLDNASVESALKLMEQLQASVYLTHPLPIHRVDTILRWAASDQYRAILAGTYEQDERETPPQRHECGCEIQPGDTHCTCCGKKLEQQFGRLCVKCGTAVRQAQPHCGNCGADLRQPGAILER